MATAATAAAAAATTDAAAPVCRVREWSHQGVLVADQDRAKRFYMETLGLSLRFDTGADATFRWLTLQAGAQAETAGEIVLMTPWIKEEEGSRERREMEQAVQLVMERGALGVGMAIVRRLDAYCARLKEKGVRFEQDIVLKPWGMREAIVRDDSGNWISLLEMPKASASKPAGDGDEAEEKKAGDAKTGAEAEGDDKGKKRKHAETDAGAEEEEEEEEEEEGEPCILYFWYQPVVCLDQEESLDFFTQKLGMQVTGDHVHDGSAAPSGPFRWLTVGTGPTQPRHALSLSAIGQRYAGMPLAMDDEDVCAALRKVVRAGLLGVGVARVDDCRATYETLKADGVSFSQQPVERPWGVEAVANDPAGNWFAIVQPPEGGYTPTDHERQQQEEAAQAAKKQKQDEA